MTTNLTSRFILGLDELVGADDYDLATQKAKESLVDFLGCAALGHMLCKEQSADVLNIYGQVGGQSALIGMGRATSPHMAALLNGMHAHATELDDGHRFAMMHAGAPVVAALLAVAPAFHMTGAQLLRGIVVGHEAAIRLGGAIQPGHKLKGYHATATCGTVGAALGIAYAMDYTPEQKLAALTAAVTDAAGVLTVMDNTSTLKPYNVGRAAAAGVDAALVAHAGYSGSQDPLGGKRGFLLVMADEVREDYLLNGIGNKPSLLTAYRKSYAACRHCHAAIEAALKAQSELSVGSDAITGVQVKTYGLAVYGHDHADIAGSASAKMSLPYSVAVALASGKAGFRQFEGRYLCDEEVRRLAHVVHVEESEELSALVPAKRAAQVTVVTDNGSCTSRVDYPKGEPENPLLRDELEDKFCELWDAAGGDAAVASTVLRCVWNIENDLPLLLSVL